MKLIFNKRSYYQLIEAFALVFVSLTIVFILVHVMPGATAKLANSSLPLEQQKALETQYGLDQPLATQFFKYLYGIFSSFDFGISLSVRTNALVTDILGPKIAISFLLGSIALLFAMVFGYILGVIIGINGKNIFGTLGNVSIAFFMAVPTYIIGVVAVAIASSSGNASLILFNYNQPETYILPILAQTVPSAVGIANFVSVDIIEQNKEQYIKFARAKGLGLWTIMTRHMFKRGVFGTIMILPNTLVGIIIGGLFIDGTFSIPGIGSVLGQAILTKDYDVIQTLIILFAFLNSFAFWLRDLLIVLSDPRIAANIR